MSRVVKFALAGVCAVLLADLGRAQQQGQAQPQPGGVKIAPWATYGWMNQRPWFADPHVRQSLKFNDNQFNQLNQAYGQAWSQYQQGYNDLGRDMTPAERTQRIRDMQNNFNRSFYKSMGNIIADPSQVERYQQMHLQYQGPGAFYNPMVQEKINLTPEQQQRMNQLDLSWNKQMGQIGQVYQTDPTSATKQFDTMRKQYQVQLNSILTPQQQSAWQQMQGQAYNFAPNVYFQGNAAANPGNKQ
jgi:hypothetical protein